MTKPLQQRCEALLADLGIQVDSHPVSVEPLTGGVGSDIAMVDMGDRKLCVKFALPKLKVAEDWFAPVHRNRAEYEWLNLVTQVAPANAVKLLGRSETHHGFVMEYLDGDDVYLWKSSLLSGRISHNEADLLGDLLGKIHLASTLSSFDTSPFQNMDDFIALRIEPYLSFTANRCPKHAQQLEQLASQLANSNRVIVHGDVSPKNIFFHHGKPLILDAECATMGDASFDCAFLINHLALKAVHLPDIRDTLVQSINIFWSAYVKQVSWESRTELESRICHLLAGLLLARVDGKSPVEYLNPTEQQRVRDISSTLFQIQPENMKEWCKQFSNCLAS
ncbi:MAG: aminoglycoside phosphotransferase family protein [Acidiferrobacterales bacterium]|nr:aminoglycoside phosphotransferase family protein [Acidiferrobacterales bacterium]